MNVTGPIKVLIAANGTANALLAGRVYPGVIPHGTAFPAAAITIVGGSGNETKSGVSDTDALRVQVDVYGSTYSGASEADEAIRGAIDFYAGNVTLPAGGGIVTINSISFMGHQDNFEKNPELFRKISEYRVRVRR